MTPTPPFNPRAPFTRAEAMAAGLTAWQLRGKDWARIFRNVYVSREVPRTVAVRARAAMRLAPAGTVVSHQTAALLWGGTVPDTSVIHVKIGYRKTFDVDGVRAHRSCRPHTGTRRHGVAVTTPEQTIMDLATDLDLVQLVVLGDRLVKRKVTTAAKLVDAADSWDGYHAALARRAAGLVRPGVDSPPESRLRLLIVLAGLPEPTVNHIIRNPETGDWARRFELAYEDLLLAIEYEGRHHRGDDDVWADDIDRREDLDRRSWRVVQVISDGLFEHPLRTLQRIEQARLDRGAPATGAFLDDWRRYFPGRDVA